MAEYTEYITAPACRYVASHFIYLRRVVSLNCSREHLDDCFSDIVYTAISKAFDTYVESMGVAFDTHAIGYVKRYCQKWYAQRDLDANRLWASLSAAEDNKNDKSSQLAVAPLDELLLDASDEVQYVLQGLDKTQKAVVHLRLVEQWEWKQIATDVLGVSVATAISYFNNAMLIVNQNALKG